MNFTPEILKFENGKEVSSKADFALRRKEIIDILSKNEYGYTPKTVGKTTYVVKETITKCLAGHGVQDKLLVTFPTHKGDFTFPVNYFHPTNVKKHPTFIFINFRPDDYDMYYPVEEIIDSGCAVAQFYYKDITDDGPALDGIASMFDRRNDGTDWGKIGMWAYAASRLADILSDLPETEYLAVLGHSRLGKTALWCGAQDERIKFVFSNNSGCSGAAYERIKHGKSETVEKITKVFPFWFCENYKKYALDPDSRPFDQHMLLALIAPRFLGVGSSSLDFWADQYSEQLSCIAAGEVWEKIFDMPGFIGTEEPAEVSDSFSKGSVHYHLRDGIHFLSRNDWNEYIAFMKSKQNISDI